MRWSACAMMSLCVFGMACALQAADSVSVQPPYSWRGVDGSGVFPAKDLVTSFADIAEDYTAEELQKMRIPATFKPGMRKNIVWRTLLPNWGNNAPIAVGDKVFVLCNEGWKSNAPLLVCLDAKDGKIIWQKEVDHMDAWAQDQAAIGKECRAKELARWRKYMGWWNKLYWDNSLHAWKAGASGRKGSTATMPVSPEQAQLVAQAKAAGLNMAPAQGIGVGGGTRGRYGLGEDMGDGAANFKKCVENRYYWYQGWTSEAPWYGSVMGSVVSDGRYVYAVTALSAAACFDMDGKRLWVTDLGAKPLHSGLGCHLNPVHYNISSPVLADDKLLYYDRDGGMMLGLDKASGRIVYKTAAPVIPAASRKKEPQRPGYEGHFAPGGTPVVMRIPTATSADAPLVTVVVSGHGMVVRVSDGAMLGQVTMPKPGEEGAGTPSSSYNSWTAKDDVLFCQRFEGAYYAIKLHIEDNALRQEMKWRSEHGADNRNPNLILAGGQLIAGPVKDIGQIALDILRGKVTAKGPPPQGYSTGLAAGDGKITFRGSVGYTYTVVSLPDLKPVGSGVLLPPKPAGEVLERHIAFLGKAQIGGGWTGITCFGNRIYARDTDYLWCLGDPSKPYLPAEAVK